MVNKKEHLVVVDGVKGFCCLLVMMAHYRFTKFNFPSVLFYIALHAFFLFSAYLISRNLLIDKEKGSTFSNYFKLFYIKRTLRIFPIYFLYIFVIALITLLFVAIGKLPDNLANEWKHYGWMHFLFVANYRDIYAYIMGYTDYIKTAPVMVHLWSVSIEEQFYIFIVFAIFFLNKKTLRILTIAAIIIFPIFRVIGYYWLLEHSKDATLSTLAVVHASIFQFDVFFYGLLPNVFNLRNWKNPYKWLLISFIALMVWIYFSSYIISMNEGVSFMAAAREDQYIYSNGGIYFIDILTNFTVLSLVLTVVWFPQKLKFFTHKVWLILGAPSYSIYIFQFLFLIVFFILTGLSARYIPSVIAQLLGCAFYIISTVWLGTILFKYIEVPMFKLKDKLTKRFVGDKSVSKT